MEVTRRVTVVYSVVLVDKKEFFFFQNYSCPEQPSKFYYPKY